MLIGEYRKEFCRPPNPGAEHLRGVAYLDADISEVFPYLNTVLCGHQYFTDPPSLTLKLPGKLVTLHARDISINILEDEAEADRIFEWLKEKVNETWDRRGEIRPTHEIRAKPRVIEILRLLPKTNCGECGLPTCMVFAVQMSDGQARLEECSHLEGGSREKIQHYIDQFSIGVKVERP
jgi:ArsR family metal-binding transcriptional regulator